MICCQKKEEAKRTMEEVPPRNLWPPYEWEDVVKEDFEDGILLEYNGNRLHRLCEKF